MITNGIFADRYGRLGNQLFQVSLLVALRERHGYDFHLPREGATIWDVFDLDVAHEGPECEQIFHEHKGWIVYDPDVLDAPDGTSFHGYFQSFRYFDEHRETLLQFLQMQPQFRAHADALLFGLRRRSGKPIAALHVRRTDYLQDDMADVWGDLAGDGYYERAVASIGDDVEYLVFSDDIDWCRQHFDEERFGFADLDHATSLALMSRCDVNVIANSSYSWWAAYLNPTAEVYAPAQWFGPRMAAPNDRPDDILLPSWRTIPVSWGDRGQA